MGHYKQESKAPLHKWRCFGKKYERVVELLYNLKLTIHPIYWAGQGCNISLHDSSVNLEQILSLLKFGSETGNDAPNGDRNGYIVKLTAKSNRHTNTFM